MDGTTSYIQPLYIPSAGEVHHSGVATQHEKSLLSSHRNSTATGKLVLQDLEGVIEEAEAFGLEEKIVPMKHDFFTKQPVHGPIIHSCLHNWPDSKAHDILVSLKPGLTKGYSKLLINENVIPDQGAYWISTGLDMVMMANFSASERTKQNWRELLESAGFKLVKIWTFEPGTESLIEAELS